MDVILTLKVSSDSTAESSWWRWRLSAFNASPKANGLVFELGVIGSAFGGAVDGVKGEVNGSRGIALRVIRT